MHQPIKSNSNSFNIPYLNSLYKKHFLNLSNEISHLHNPSINDTLYKLNYIFQLLTTAFTDIALKTYEPIIKHLENKNRSLIRNYLQFNLQKEAYENKLILLLHKEKEYNLVKESTGVIVEDGKVMCANHKENEIIILRAENSNLKTQINKIENKLKHYQQKEFELRQKYLKDKQKLLNKIDLLKQQINSTLLHKSTRSQSNININLNDVSHSNLVIKRNHSKYKRNSNKVIKGGENTDDVNSTEGYTVKYQVSPTMQTTTNTVLYTNVKCGKSKRTQKGEHQLKVWFKKKNLFLSPCKTLTHSMSPTIHSITQTHSNNKRINKVQLSKRKNKKVFVSTNNNFINNILSKGSLINRSNSAVSSVKDKIVHTNHSNSQRKGNTTQRTRSVKSFTQRNVNKK